MPRGLPEGRSFGDEGVRLSDGREPSVWDACPTAPSRRGLTVRDHEISGPPMVTATNHGSHDDPGRLAEDLLTGDGSAAPSRMPGIRRPGITFLPEGTTS
ncbi:hypothetical protein Pta02_29870 [Planobispora takensis]|uniref:Uncharacterized protein n=1 Tax=Planobispora takensis TaxID=1367882 RepID=A0A8J3T4R6_9ACTN|nr:hypothetical protein Pta02_29870 [Planobispora takensis]